MLFIYWQVSHISPALSKNSSQCCFFCFCKAEWYSCLATLATKYIDKSILCQSRRNLWDWLPKWVYILRNEDKFLIYHLLLYKLAFARGTDTSILSRTILVSLEVYKFKWGSRLMFERIERASLTYLFRAFQSAFLYNIFDNTTLPGESIRNSVEIVKWSDLFAVSRVWHVIRSENNWPIVMIRSIVDATLWEFLE